MQQFLLAALVSSLITAVLAMIIGMIWYGPLFGKIWSNITGVHFTNKEEKKKAQKEALPLYVIQFFLSMVMFFGFVYFSMFVGRLNMVGSIVFGLLIWFAFVMPTEAGNALWSNKSKKLSWQMFLITTGYNLVLFVCAGIVWTLVFPYFLG